MKKIILFLILIVANLHASLQDKSAIVYYGSEISYPLVGIHDYIIVQPRRTNTYTHGFSLYKENIYAYVAIGEIHQNTPEFEDINKSWIVEKNVAWESEVLDINNQEYQNFIFTKQIEPLMQKGFKNFFFDTLDSYYFYSKTPQQIAQSQNSLVEFINEFHNRYPDAKLVINRGFGVIDKVHSAVDAVLFESYYKGLRGEKLEYADVSEPDREWLDIQIKNIKKYGIDLIALDYMKDISKADNVVDKLKAKGLIPYVSHRELTNYGKSSKNAIKREILTLVDESKQDRSMLSAHLHGAVVFEYLGYIQKLHDISKGYPDPSSLDQYAGVVIWIQTYSNKKKEFLKWLNELIKYDIKVVFVGNFGADIKGDELKKFGIRVSTTKMFKESISVKDTMMGYEIMPSLGFNPGIVHVDNAQTLLEYKYQDNTTSTPAAITSWGGYAVQEAFITDINNDIIWVINPFEFFPKALALKKLPVPDPTTENGKRLLFSHVDGDGLANKVEGKFGKYSGDVIYNHILQKYKIPHSISIIGADLDPNLLTPELRKELSEIVKKIYSLDNVEGASHTYTHPFIWGKVVDGNLSEDYRLKVPEYEFSLENELKRTLENINNDFYSKDKAEKANTIFWSGDCIPREGVLDYVYKNNILAINGGDTTIQSNKPLLSLIAPFGLKRGEYYQIYTGAQNENVYTDNWLGGFWGFKRVIQTFKLTESPRRFKPIDIYYHIYSGSKRASLESLKVVFDWAIKQDVMPIFTSEYIPKVMDMYEVSIANEGDEWLFSGMRDLKTIRYEKLKSFIDFNNSKGVVGLKQKQDDTYISIGTEQKALLKLSNENKDANYLISSNGKLTDFNETATIQRYEFQAHVPLEINMYVKKGCKVLAEPKAAKSSKEGGVLSLKYKKSKKATITLECGSL